jgi:hypothetical protein
VREHIGCSQAELLNNGAGFGHSVGQLGFACFGNLLFQSLSLRKEIFVGCHVVDDGLLDLGVINYVS